MDTNLDLQDTPLQMPLDMKIDDRAIKRMAGEAIRQVDGVLGLDGSVTDVLKGSDDATRGIALTLSGDGKTAQMSAKIVAEYGKNIPIIVDAVQEKAAQTLRDMAGLQVEKMEVEVTDVMTREEYHA